MSDDLKDDSIKVTIDTRAFDRLPITVRVSLTAEEWHAFGQHCEKTGSSTARKLFEQVKPVLEKIKQAKELLK